MTVRNDDEFINAEITVKLQLVGNENALRCDKSSEQKQCRNG